MGHFLLCPFTNYMCMYLTGAVLSMSHDVNNQSQADLSVSHDMNVQSEAVSYMM